MTEYFTILSAISINAKFNAGFLVSFQKISWNCRIYNFSWDETIGDYYYFNSDTGDTQWAHPLDEIYRQKVDLAREQFRKDNVTDVSGDTSEVLTTNSKMDKPPLKLVGAVPSLGQVTENNFFFWKIAPNQKFVRTHYTLRNTKQAHERGLFRLLSN